MVLVLTDADVAQAATWREKIDALEEAFSDWGAGQALSGERMDHHILREVPVPTDGGVESTQHPGSAAARVADQGLLDFRFMFGLLPRRDVAALRIVNATWCFPEVAGSRRAVVDAPPDGRVPAFVLVFSTRTGQVEALIPDALLQRDRVVCTGAVGARLLARTQARTLGLVGTGNMAAGYLRALGSDRRIDRVLVHSPNPDHRRRFAEQNSVATGLDVHAVDTAREAASADIVCLATNARQPVVDTEWIRPGAHVIVTNLHEVAVDRLRDTDRLVITCHDRGDGWNLRGRSLPSQADQIAALMGGAWSPRWTQDGAASARVATAPDLGDLLAGRGPGRAGDREVTWHLNQSASVQFPAIAWITACKAREHGRGTELPDRLFTTVPPGELPSQPLDPVATRRTDR